jgi:hypothetical protein
VIFVDSNVPMYLVGGTHPHKLDARRLLDEAIHRGEKLVTDVEVFQEILHRYVAIGRREAIQPAWDLLGAVIDETYAIDRADVERARGIVLERHRLSARDAMHLAVMERRKVSRVMSFDAGFDGLPGIVRLA